MKHNTFKIVVIVLTLLTFSIGKISAFDLYVRGYNSWDASNNNKMIDRGSNTQSVYLSMTANTTYTFKIADGSWSTYNYGGSGSPTLGSAYTLVSGGGNISFKPTKTALYLLSVNTSTWKLTITEVKPTAAAPSTVVSGTNKMFYISGYEGLNYLVNSSKTKAATSYPMIYTGYSYVNTAASLTTYDRISNNPSGWSGDENTNIKTANGGELFSRDGTKTAYRTATTTTSVSGDVLSISTTTSSTTSVYSSMPLYIQYFIDNSFVGVTYNSSTASYASIPAGGGTARASTYNVSGLTNGSHTLKTILTDGLVYYIAKSNSFTVAHSYTVTLDQQSGSGGSTSVTATYNASMPSATMPTRNGYVFNGYYDATNGSGTKYYNANGSSARTWNKTAAATLYAYWVPVWAIYNNTTKLFDFEYVSATSYRCEITGSTLTSNHTQIHFKKDGVTWYFTGADDPFSRDVLMQIGEGMLNWPHQTSNMTLYLTYKSSAWYLTAESTGYAVTLNKNGGSADGSATAHYWATSLSSITPPTRSGYSVDGYYKEAGLTNLIADADGTLHASTTYTDASGHWTGTGAVTLYAKWSANSYNWYLKKDATTLGTFTDDGSNTFHLDYNLTAANNTQLHFTCAELSYSSAPGSETHLGYANKRTMVNNDGRNTWYDGVGKYRFHIVKVSGTWYLYADKLFNVTYYGNSNTSGSVPTDATDYVSGSMVTVKGNTGSLVRTGYDFGGWNTNSSGTGTTYTAGTGTFSITANTSLYAKWIAKTFTVNLNGNGGTGHTSSVTATYNSSSLSSAITAPTRAGYTFGGWYSGSGGTGNLVINSSGVLQANVSGYTGAGGVWTATENKTLYAKWTETLTTVTINVNPAGAGTLTVGGSAFTAGNTTTAGAATSRTVVATAGSEYVFSGWTVTGNATGSNSTNTYTLRGNGSGSTGTLTANFTPKTKVRLYYSNPNGWATVYAYLWNSANTSDKNAEWHGTNITSNTYNYNCNTYYYYEYYKEDHPNWNRIIFNDNGSNQSADITFSNTTNNGQYYIGSSWVASPAAKWVLAGSMDSWSTTSHPLVCASATSGYVDIDLNANTEYSFKFINKESSTWYGVTTATRITYDNKATAQTMNNTAGGSANQTILTAGKGTYRFSWDITNKKVTVTYPTSYTVTFSANTIGGSNGHSAVPTATVDAVALTSGKYVTSGSTVSFSAKAAKTGYTFNGWYTATTGGTQLSASATYNRTISANTTIYARYTQNTHTVTLTNANASYGTVNTSSPVTVGEAEAVQIRATNNFGYKFAGWTKTAGSGTVTYWTAAGTSGSSDAIGATKATTYIKVTGDVTLQATWEPDYSTGWYLAGTFSNGGGSDLGWTTGKVEFTKRTGESTGRVAYVTMDLTNTTFASNGYHMELKVMTGSTWYGNTGIYTHDANDGTAWTMTSGAISMNLTVSLTGTYTFKLDYSGASPKLTIYYPIINQLQVYDAYPTHAAAVSNWEWDSHVGTTYTKTLALNANTKYKFKPVYNSVFYGFKTGSPLSGDNNGDNPMTAYNCTNWRTYNDGGDCFIETTLAGDYVFTFSTTANTPVSVQYPRNIILSCDANSWAQSTTNMTLLSGTTYYYDIDLPADNLQEFKVVYNSQWYGGLSSEITLTSTDCTNKVMSAGASCYNMRVATTMAGRYRFKFNTSTSQVSVEYPTPPVTAMTGSLSLAATGIVKGTGTSADPWVVFKGNTMTVTATHTSKPATATDHIFYQFTDNAVAKPQQTTLTYNPSTAATTDKKTIKVDSYYEYGPAGFKKQGTHITSTTYYYQVIERPTVTIDVETEILKGSTMVATYTPENTSVAGISAPTYRLYYKQWNGSAWGAETAANSASTTNPQSIATSAAKYTVGFYQWYVKMTYGGTTITSNVIQNVIYQTYQVTVICSGYAITSNKAWFKGLYAWRSPDGFSPSTNNATYPGQARDDCSMEVDDYTYVYSFKYPIYTHIQLNDNTSSTVNRTESIEITDNTCIEITGERFRSYDNWAFTKTAPCATTYYRVRSVYGDKTYYSNAVTSTSDLVSFFAGESSDADNKLYKETLTNGRWVPTLITPTVSKSDVYYAPFKSVQTTVTLYTGSFYVRTDGSTNTWNDYADGNKTMYKFENNTLYPNEYYNHYWCAYLQPGVNVMAQVANDINRNLAVTLPEYLLPAQTASPVNNGTNVRFAYNNTNNLFEVTFLQAANIETFLQLYGLGDGGDISKNYCYKEEALTHKLTSSYKLNMSDLSDWMYQADFYVNAPGNDETYIDIIANYKKDGTHNDIIHLGGLDEDRQVIPFLVMGNTTTASIYLIRVIYDYKTNRVVAAWLPYGSDLPNGILDANMMIIRTDDNEAKTVGVPGSNKTLSDVHKIYGVLEITKADYYGKDCDDCDADDGHLGKENRQETGNKFYWICLPFDVKVKDVFGIDGFKTKWAIQRYRGDLRANNGYHEGQTFWRNMNANETATMEAGRGYVIWLNLTKEDFKNVTYIDENGVTRTRSQKRLFFPSDNTSDFTLTYDGSTISTVLPPNECEIEDRRNEDSNWYVAGIKGYNDSEVNSPADLGANAGTESGAPAYTPPYYFYEWSWDKDGNHQSDNYTAHSVSGYTFKPFYSYMFQYAGTITWEPTDIKTIKPSPARQGILANQKKSETLITVTLENEVRQLDQTFITLTNRSNITEDYDLNGDLTKIINPRSQIYTYAGKTKVAGNVTPSTTERIPLGVVAKETDNYIFHLEDLPANQMVYLYDQEQGTRTCLNYNDFEVILDEGNYNERFFIELAQMPSIATDIDSDSAITLNVAQHNGSLYIEGIENGEVINLYDMTGRQIISTRYNIGEGITTPPTGIYLLTTNHSTNKIIIQ